jgi:hypothetical protein
MSIRRWPLWVALLGVLACPLAVRAQANKPHRVAVVLNGNDADSMSYHAAFLEGLRGLGYVVGTNLVLDLRNTNGDSTRLPAAVDEAIVFRS